MVKTIYYINIHLSTTNTVSIINIPVYLRELFSGNVFAISHSDWLLVRNNGVFTSRRCWGCPLGFAFYCRRLVAGCHSAFKYMRHTQTSIIIVNNMERIGELGN